MISELTNTIEKLLEITKTLKLQVDNLTKKIKKIENDRLQ